MTSVLSADTVQTVMMVAMGGIVPWPRHLYSHALQQPSPAPDCLGWINYKAYEISRGQSINYPHSTHRHQGHSGSKPGMFVNEIPCNNQQKVTTSKLVNRIGSNCSPPSPYLPLYTIFTFLLTLWNSEKKNGLFKKLFCFSTDFDETWWNCSTNG